MLAPELTLADVVPGRPLEALLRTLRPSADGSVAVLVALTEHPHPAVRTALAQRLPLLPHGPSGPAPALVSALARLVGDDDAGVREAACFALATMWRDHDAPGLCDALAARLEEDDDEEVRDEALLGLAHRRDPRALAAVGAALADADGAASRLVLEAAGALGDPRLHELVRSHAEAWLADPDADPSDLDVVEAVVRLTDAEGLGDDLLDGVADLCRARAHARLPGRALAAWEQLDAVLDLAPHRARDAVEEVAVRLDGDAAALEHLRERSALGQLAAALPPA